MQIVQKKMAGHRNRKYNSNYRRIFAFIVGKYDILIAERDFRSLT